MDTTRHSQKTFVRSKNIIVRSKGYSNAPAAVVLLNVLSFFDPLRQLIQNGISEGFVNSSNANLIVFVDGPTSHEEHESFDWGTAALQAFQSWNGDNIEPMFDWTKGKDGRRFDEGSLGVV